MEKIYKEIKPSIMKIFMWFLVLGTIILLFSCSSPNVATIKEKRETAIVYITDRSFSVKDSFKLKFDSLNKPEFGILNKTIERISGREIVHDTLKLRYNFTKNEVEADFKTKPDTVFKEVVIQEKTQSEMVPRPWGEILVFILIGIFISAVIGGLIYWWKKWR